MRRLVRPAAFTLASVAAVVVFVLTARLGAEPLAWKDLGGWLDRVEPVDAFAELARWLGLGLAVYVALVSAAALLAETAGLVRMPRLQQWLRRLVEFVALPVLRRRLLEFTTVATITASSLQAAPVGADHGRTAPVSLVVDSVEPVLSAPRVRGEFQGFGFPATPAVDGVPVGAHVVQGGDTLWDIVRDHYGRVDPELLRLVVDANPQITAPDLIYVGWQVRFPDVSEVAAPALETPTVRGEATWAVIIVQPGDTLWDIVERHYGHATAELVWATVDANSAIDDPDLIYPGQQITLAPAAELTPIAPPNASEPIAPPSPATVSPEPAPVPAVTSAEPPIAEPAQHVPRAPPPEAPTTTRTVPDGPAVPATPLFIGDRVEAIADDDAPGPSIAQLVGWTGGAGLAAALLALAARRRRRLPTAERHRRPSERAVELGVALRETDNLSTVDWAANALRSLASCLRPRPGEPTPVPRLLRLDGEQIELVWDSPNPETLEPWTSADGGWSWTRERAPDDAVTDKPSPCPTFVTIGRREGADVLLNLESCGAISITGDPETAIALQHAITAELATSAFADAPTLLVVGGHTPPGRPEHALVVEVAEALGWMRDRADSASALLAHRRLTSLFALRARSRPQDSHEPVVVLLDPADAVDDDVANLVNLANGDLGTVLVVAGDRPLTTWRLHCAGGAVEVQPLGLTLKAIGLPTALGCVIDEYIPPADPHHDDAAESEDIGEVAGSGHVLAEHLMIVHERDPAPSSTARVGDDWDVELKVLGQVRSVGTKEPLTPTELHLAIYLSFHRNGQNSDTISTMVWPKGAAPRTITNTMASLRRKLGTGSDGEMLFPLGRDNQYVYRLSPRVITDWDRFIALTKRADLLPSEECVTLLDEALELIDGPPFRAAMGYSWAYSDGTATLMTETVKAVASRCVELHLERSEHVAAGVAASHGAKIHEGDSLDDTTLGDVADALGVKPAPRA